MTSEIRIYSLGVMDNRSYLLADSESKEAVVIDPSFEADRIAADARQQGFRIRSVLLTHAHFDHIAGIADLIAAASDEIQVCLHPADLDLYQQGGGGRQFGLPPVVGPEPGQMLRGQQVLQVGEIEVHVMHTPGHTPGHVVFYVPSAGVVFCGDLVFAGSVGRTDLPGGDFAQLIKSIRQTILTLPPKTRLLSGHGPETTVEREVATNPFLT